jgi:hypothetical protein
MARADRLFTDKVDAIVQGLELVDRALPVCLTGCLCYR